MLDHETTIKLIEKSQNGDIKAKEELVINNIQLVKSIAKRYLTMYVEYEDLIQIGNIGLLKAIDNFDISFSTRFSTYAVPMIAGEIKRFLRDDGIIKVPRATKTLSHKIKAFSNDYSMKNGKAPSILEISKKFNISEEEVSYALESSIKPISLFEKVDDDSSICVIDKIESPENNDDLINKIMLKEMINSLPKREKAIIILRYYRDKTQSEIASLLGVSQVQVSRIEGKILKEFKDKFQK